MGGGACLDLSSWGLWGLIVAWGGGGGVVGNKRGETWVSFVLPNFQFILLSGEVANGKGAPRTRTQKIGLWGLGFRFLIPEPRGRFISAGALRVEVNDLGSC